MKINITVSEVLGWLEELWPALDALFDELAPADWQRRHGPDWTFADVPYHLAYIDRLCVARPIEFGEDLPPDQRFQLRTLNEVNVWNDSHFAARAQDQTVEESQEQMHSSREAIRQVTAPMTDADSTRPVWLPLLTLRGWRPAGAALAFCAGHTWQHMEEARVRHGHPGTMVGPELTHVLLDGIIPGMPLYLPVASTTLALDAERARADDFSFAFNITGPGGGLWAFRPSAAGWIVEETADAHTDLVMSLDLDSYIKLRHFISDTPTLLETGAMEVNDVQALARFNRLAVMPDLDFVFPQIP